MVAHRGAGRPGRLDARGVRPGPGRPGRPVRLAQLRHPRRGGLPGAGRRRPARRCCPTGGDLPDRLARDAPVTVLDLPTPYWHELVAEHRRGSPGRRPLRLVILGGEQVHEAAVAALARALRRPGPAGQHLRPDRGDDHRHRPRELDGAGRAARRSAGPIGGHPVLRARRRAAAGAGRARRASCASAAPASPAATSSRPDLTAERFVPDPYGEPGAGSTAPATGRAGGPTGSWSSSAASTTR